jgi:hypothetical protein
MINMRTAKELLKSEQETKRTKKLLKKLDKIRARAESERELRLKRQKNEMP